MSLYETFQLAVIVLMLAVFGLSRAANRYQDSEWLQPFRRIFTRLPEEQRRKAARHANVYTGVQMTLFGIALPFGYLVLEMMMFFSETTVTEMVFVGAASLLCIGFGVAAIWRNRP